jgi:hypothetical protein
MDWGVYREPVKVNERALVNRFEEFCYLNGGTIIGEPRDMDDPKYQFRCQIPGVGEFSLSKKTRMKRLRIRDLAGPTALAPTSYINLQP